MDYTEKEKALLEDLKALIERGRNLFFTDPAYPGATDAAVMGIFVSKILKWEFGPILDAAFEAFEDANFHEFGEAVKELAGGSEVHDAAPKLLSALRSLLFAVKHGAGSTTWDEVKSDAAYAIKLAGSHPLGEGTAQLEPKEEVQG